jgi:regulatory protein
MQAYTVKQAFTKIASFCAYQERCHQEVREKLQTFQLTEDEMEEVIVLLINDNYLNEQRFAIAFAGGKFRVKSWGKIKIRYELQQRNISSYCIQKALESIDNEEYYEKLVDIATKKAQQEQLRSIADKQKLYNFLASKGYESSLIQEVMKEIEK